MKDNKRNQEQKRDNNLGTFEETIKRLLELPPKKQSEIKGKKKDISK
jgi:hypothetical protein